MMTLLFWLTLWAVTAPITYLVVRRDHRSANGKWTQIDRLFWAIF